MLNRIKALRPTWETVRPTHDPATCTHDRLRATDYDESYHWVVECGDCGHLGSMTQAEWRAWARAHVPAVAPLTLVIDDVGADSGRVDISSLRR